MPREPENGLDCEQIFALLSEYLDQEVSPEMAAIISEHVAGCEPCVEFVESLRKSMALCQQYRTDVIPAPLAEDIRNQLRQSFNQMLKARRAQSPE